MAPHWKHLKDLIFFLEKIHTTKYSRRLTNWTEPFIKKILCGWLCVFLLFTLLLLVSARFSYQIPYKGKRRRFCRHHHEQCRRLAIHSISPVRLMSLQVALQSTDEIRFGRMKRALHLIFLLKCNWISSS
jgi:hypothetical protein